MTRRQAVCVITIGLLSVSSGCRHSCCGSGSLSSNAPVVQPTGSYSVINNSPAPTYFEPAAGVPVSNSGSYPTGTLIPGYGVPVMPSPQPNSPANELPYPAPSDTIPRPSIPFSQPDPSLMGGSSKTGQPAKTNK